MDLDNNGSCFLYNDGSNEWRRGKGGKQSIVRLKSTANIKELAKKITDLMIGKDIFVYSYRENSN